MHPRTMKDKNKKRYDPPPEVVERKKWAFALSIRKLSRLVTVDEYVNCPERITNINHYAPYEYGCACTNEAASA